MAKRTAAGRRFAVAGWRTGERDPLLTETERHLHRRWIAKPENVGIIVQAFH
jgi:hypothetical protein